MKSRLVPGLACAVAALLAGCNEEPAANKFCKGADGTVQDCGIACETSKEADVCKLFETKTKALCNKAGKATCQSLCDKDKNAHACAYVKTMK